MKKSGNNYGLLRHLKNNWNRILSIVFYAEGEEV